MENIVTEIEETSQTDNEKENQDQHQMQEQTDTKCSLRVWPQCH